MTTVRARHSGWAAVALVCLVWTVDAGAVPPGYTVTAVHTFLGFPVALRFAPDGRLFYLERTGRVLVFDSDSDPTPSVWATLPTETTTDRGLLGIALHPAWADSPYVYLFHSNPSPLEDRIVRLRDQGGIGTDLAVIRAGIPSTTPGHYGGRLAFATDGTLWLTYGDQGSRAAAQDPADIHGKLLRFTSMGEDVPGNLFGGGAGVVMGIRNSFGLCFDPLTGNGYFTDNGPECDDEVNLIEVGANYGWGPGDFCGSQPVGTRLALASFTPPFAPTGCVVYRGTVSPLLDGVLFFGGYVDRSIRAMYFTPGSDGTQIDSVSLFHESEGNVLDLTVGNDGKLWFSTNDHIYRIDPPEPTGVTPADSRAARLRLAPNPFAGSVTITLDGATGLIEIIDLAGRRLRGWPSTAAVTWDGHDENGRESPPGLYLIRAVAGDRVVQGRLVKMGHR